MKFVYTFINSFIRTLARILCYAAIGGLLGYVVAKMGFKLPLFTLQTYALTDEFNFNASTIGGKRIGSSENFIGLPKNQFNTVPMDLTLNYYHYYGYVNQPIKENQLVNVLFVSCTNPLHPIQGLYSSKKNFLDLNYVSNEKCAWSWENEPTGRVQYTFVRLKYDSVSFDELDNDSGTIMNWYYKFNTQSFGIQGLSYDSSIYFTSISYLDSGEYNNLLSQYRTLSGQNTINNSINDLNGSVNDVNNTLKDESGPNTDALQNSSGWLPAGPLDSLINLPLSLLNNLTTNMSKSCQPVNLPLPFIDKNLQLPCVNTIYSQIDGLSVWINSVSIIAAAFILFHYLMGLYKWVDDTLSFRENNYIDNWTGV